MFAVIVKNEGWGGARRLRPFVVEVTRDCPKTLFAKSGWGGGENRYGKDQHVYRLFDGPIEAETFCAQLKESTGVKAAQQATDHARKLEDEADSAMQKAIANWRN